MAAHPARSGVKLYVSCDCAWPFQHFNSFCTVAVCIPRELYCSLRTWHMAMAMKDSEAEFVSISSLFKIELSNGAPI